MRSSLNVLFVSPSAQVDPTYLPYVFGILKTYCEQDPRIADRVRWFKPLYRRLPADELLEGCEASEVDVLGLSCYLWNWSLQKRVARTIKESNPDCLVVGGGPQCDANDPRFFQRNPCFDVVVAREGEEPFRRVLREALASTGEWSSIPGLYLPDEEGLSTRTEEAGLQEISDRMKVSPYQAQSSTYEEILREIQGRGHDVTAMFESNRGCPFRCAYCDWGGLTGTAVRTLPLERVQGDIDWLTRQGVENLYLVDSNVGRLDRDVQIIKYLCDAKVKTDYPKFFIWNFTKTDFENARKITELLHQHNMIRGGMSLFLQHTNPDVLEAINRQNPPPDLVQHILDFNERHDLHHAVWLMLGCPSDTYSSWKRCFADLMEMGVDGWYVVTNFHLLPNSPAFAPDYLRTHQIRTTTTRNLSRIDIDDATHRPDLGYKKLVTGTRTFDSADWCRMWIYAYFMRGAHSRGITRKLALYLHYLEGVSFYRFYGAFVDELCHEPASFFSSLYRRMFRAKKALLEGEDRPLHRVLSDDITDDSYYPTWREWLHFKLVINRERVFRELGGFVRDRFVVNTARFDDLLEYQKRTLVAPDYSPEAGLEIVCDYDWLEYFQRPRQELSQVPEEGIFVYRADRKQIEGWQMTVPITWHEKTGQKRQEEWFEAVVKDPIGKMYPTTTHTLERVETDTWRQTLRRGTKSLGGWIGLDR